MTTPKFEAQKYWMKFIPKPWKAIIAIVMVLGVPATPFIKDMSDSYIADRVDIRVAPIKKKVETNSDLIAGQKKSIDSLIILGNQTIEEMKKLNQHTQELKEQSHELNDWLIKNNRNNRNGR